MGESHQQQQQQHLGSPGGIGNIGHNGQPSPLSPGSQHHNQIQPKIVISSETSSRSSPSSGTRAAAGAGGGAHDTKLGPQTGMCSNDGGAADQSQVRKLDITPAWRPLPGCLLWMMLCGVG